MPLNPQTNTALPSRDTATRSVPQVHMGSRVIIVLLVRRCVVLLGLLGRGGDGWVRV